MADLKLPDDIKKDLDSRRADCAKTASSERNSVEFRYGWANQSGVRAAFENFLQGGWPKATYRKKMEDIGIALQTCNASAEVKAEGEASRRKSLAEAEAKAKRPRNK